MLADRGVGHVRRPGLGADGLASPLTRGFATSPRPRSSAACHIDGRLEEGGGPTAAPYDVTPVPEDGQGRLSAAGVISHDVLTITRMLRHFPTVRHRVRVPRLEPGVLQNRRLDERSFGHAEHHAIETPTRWRASRAPSRADDGRRWATSQADPEPHVAGVRTRRAPGPASLIGLLAASARPPVPPRPTTVEIGTPHSRSTHWCTPIPHLHVLMTDGAYRARRFVRRAAGAAGRGAGGAVAARGAGGVRAPGRNRGVATPPAAGSGGPRFQAAREGLHERARGVLRMPGSAGKRIRCAAEGGPGGAPLAAPPRPRGRSGARHRLRA